METTNPKEQFGNAKAPSFGVPPTALIEVGLVMGGGAHKYGAYNYRKTKIKASTYIEAINRHLLKWADGMDNDEESGAHELAHVMACCALVIDAHYTGKLTDDRDKTGLVPDLLERSARLFNEMKEAHDG